MNRQTNILHIIAQLSIGGAEQQLLKLVTGLARKRFKPIVCSLTSDGTIGKKLREAEAKVIIEKKRWKYDLSIIPRLIRLMRKERISIVHTWMFTANAWGRAAAFLGGVPIIICSERGTYYNTEKSAIGRNSFDVIVNRVLASFTDRIIGNAQEVKNYLVNREKIDPTNIEVIYNGINISKFNRKLSSEDVFSTRKELGLNNNSLVITMIANLHLPKDHNTLLKAAHQVLKSFPQSQFLLVGEGPLREELERLSNRLGIDKNVVFAGARNNIPEILALTDVSVLSTHREGLPNTILESMAAGKPVVATDVDGNPEAIVDGKTGYLVPPRDPQALAEAIIKLLGNKELAMRMSIAGRKRAEDYFSEEKMIGNYEKLYEKLLKQKFVNENQ